MLTLRGPSGPRRGPALHDLSIIPDGALLIRNGVIEDIGPSRRIENLAAARGANEISASGRIVMPGFVDSHTQVIFAHSGGRRGEHRPFSTTQAVHAGAKAMQSVSSRWLQTHASSFIHGMLRHGTCSIEAKSGYGLDYTSEMKTLRAHAALNRKPIDIVSTFFGASAVPAEREHDPEGYLDHLRTEMLPTIAKRKLAHFVDIRCEDHGFTLPQARRYLEAARQLGFSLKIQIGDGPAAGVVELATELNAAAIGTSRYMAPAAAELLARSSTIATLLPNSAFLTGEEPHYPARDLIDQGGIVALASNFNPDTNPGYNMQAVISSACRHLGFTAAEAIGAATINGAHAIGSARKVGSLEPGKQADLLLLNVCDYRDLPYHSGGNTVHLTMKNGAVIYKEGEIG